MEDRYVLEGVACRIERMERCFDALLKAAQEKPAAIGKDAALRALLQELTAYYEGGQWVRDYQLDEMGLLPEELKRGVLSEDGVYNLLEELKVSGEGEKQV